MLRIQLQSPISVLVVLALLAGAITACGKKGDPLPPRRVVPATTEDLEARLEGEVLVLRLGYPQSTASGEVLPGLSAVEVWGMELPTAVPASPPAIERILFERQGRLLTTVEDVELESAMSGNRIVLQVPLRRDRELAAGERPAEAFAVRTRSPSGETSELSNRVVVFFETPPPPPRALRATARADGIELTWQFVAGEAAALNVYRRRPTERRYSEPIARLPAGTRSHLDKSAQLGDSYFYTLRARQSAESPVESATSNEIEIDYRDTFAPEPPAEVLALAEPGRVRLVIEPSSSRDVSGYRVYRKDAGADFRQVTERLLPASGNSTIEYQDGGLVAGQSYLYRVTAVDGAGNESAPTDEARVELPRP